MIFKINSVSRLRCWSESTGWSMSWSESEAESDSNSWVRCESWNRSLPVSVFRYFHVTHSRSWSSDI